MTGKNQGKNQGKDRWLSGLRAPYERVFSKRPKRLRYRGQARAQFQIAMHALAHNLKRLVTLDVGSVPI